MSCVQSNRKVGFIGMKLQFNLPGTNKISQSLYEKFVLLSKKKRMRKTLSTCQKKTTVKRIIFLTREKTSFAILIGRIIFFTCENHRSLL